jgi:polysaccharide biosynthesis protein PslG
MSARMNQVASQAGPKWIRQEFDWSQIEPQPGVFDFSRYDQFVLLAAQHNIRVLPLLFETPAWAGSNWNTIPSDPSAYAAYVAAVVGRYGPHGSFWSGHPGLASYAIQTFELWNEPYYDNGNDGDYDPGRYARLVKAAAIAGRQADPAARFLLAAENQAHFTGNAWVWWIDALYQAVPDLNNYFDGVAVHPYGTNLTDLSFPTPGQAYDGYEQIRRVEAIHQEFANHNAAGKPLWITEVGWPTCTSGSDRCTTPAGQAADLATVFDYARTTWKNFVQAVFVYSYDDANPDSSNPENDYGLAYNDGTPKPALAVFKSQAAAN